MSRRKLVKARIVSLAAVCGLLILAACQPQTDASPTYTAEVGTPLRDCPQTDCAVRMTLPAGESAPVVERLDQPGEGYWLKLQYEGQTLYAGLFITVASSGYAMFTEARTCPSLDCPVRFSLPHDAEVLWLETALANLDQYWTRVGYGGEEVFIGPYVPMHADAVSTAVIAASEVARASGTVPPNPTRDPQVTATFTPSPTP